MNTATATDPTAEAHSQRLHSCAFHALNENQQRAILLLIELPAHLEAMKQEQRYCMTCDRPSSLQQCMDCREGRSEGYRPRYQSFV